LDEALEGDPPEELASSEIDLLSPRAWDEFVVHEKCEVTSTALPDGLRQHRSDFGGGSHWTLIYDANRRPIGCEYENVRFVRVESRIWVYPPEGS
jgi:hypothetical protein